MTAVSFSADDLAALGHLNAVGQAVLQKRPPVVARLKAAMTRMAFHSRKVSWRFGRQGWALVSANNADFDAAAPRIVTSPGYQSAIFGNVTFPTVRYIGFTTRHYP
jgi:hypothetical protein